MESKYTPEGWEKCWEETNSQIHEGVNPHAYRLGFKDAIKHLGLNEIENPKEWVEKTLKAYTAIDITNALLKFMETTKNGDNPFTSRIQMFDTEVDSVDIILWASKADICDSPIARVVELRKELTDAQLEIVKLKSELKDTKSELEGLYEEQAGADL
jgi:hypothetical protein